MSNWELERTCWLDVETTGLDPERGLLLEIAIVVTDRWLRELAREEIVIEHSVEAIGASDLNDFVRDMHTKNGLLDDVTGQGQFKPTEISEAEHRILAILSRTCGAKAVFLGGSSPGGVDRPFLRKFMPRLYERLHYRSVDATCLALAFKAWGCGPEPQKDDKPHRALADTLATIELARRVMRFMYRGAKLIAREDGKPFTDVFTRPQLAKEDSNVLMVSAEACRQEEAEVVQSVSCRAWKP